MNINQERTSDRVIGIISLLFIILVLFLYFNRSLEGYYAAYATYTGGGNRPAFYDANATQKNCAIFVEKPTVILRFDDIRAYSVQTKPLVNELISRNLSATLAVIPRDLEHDLTITSYLASVKNRPNIEIAQHGLYHNLSDGFLTDSELNEGKDRINRLIGVEPITYVPPYNLVTPTLYQGIERNYKVFSAGGTSIKEGKIAEISGGYSIIESYITYDNSSLPSNDEILSLCDSQLRSFNLCVITFHPQEYSSTPNHAVDLNVTKFNQYKQLLDGIVKMNVSTKTFKDVVSCVSTNVSYPGYEPNYQGNSSDKDQFYSLNGQNVSNYSVDTFPQNPKTKKEWFLISFIRKLFS